MSGGWHLAQLNVARWAVDPDGETAAAFHAQLDEVNGLAEVAPGFVWRLQDESGSATDIPTPFGDDHIANLTVWQDVEALRAYTFAGRHREVMRDRRRWFAEDERATSVLWWVPAGHLPHLGEAAARLESLRRDGPTAVAFTFARPHPAPQEAPPPPAPPVTVRPGTARDLPSIAAIYTHYVLNTTTTFNTEVRTPAQWMDRHRLHVEDGPYHLLVAERGDDVVGFVETQPFRPKPAYAPSVELSIYVAPDDVGGGVGGRLLRGLLDELDGSRFHRLYAVIALPNERSVAFHERWGFVHRGTLTEAGLKFDEYLDVAFYERALP